MQIDEVILHELEMTLVEPFHTPLGSHASRRFLLVEARAGGCSGYGEAAVLTHPTYNEETPETAWHILEAYLIPIALNTEWTEPSELAAAFSPIRRHYMAKAGLEQAAWDLYAKARGQSLAQTLGAGRTRVDAGAAVGLTENDGELVERVGRCLREGYRRIKVKIRPGRDEAPLAAIRDAFGEIPLMADANSAYTLQDLDRLRRLDRLRLLMIEQPLAAGDIIDHARLQSELETPICLDESISSLDDARRAIELGSCRVINIKAPRVGGLSEARRIHDYCQARGIPVWCGGMLESGVGRAHNIALAALPNFRYPGDLSAARRYWREDIVEPEAELSPDGTLPVPAGPGIGVRLRMDRIERLTLRRRAFSRADYPSGSPFGPH